MSSTNHYRDQIQRATHRLAQLQARELLAHQRQDAREKAIKRRDDAKRRRQVAELVFWPVPKTCQTMRSSQP